MSFRYKGENYMTNIEYFDIREELIKEELSRVIEAKQVVFKQIKITKDLVDKLFKNYNVLLFDEEYYDEIDAQINYPDYDRLTDCTWIEEYRKGIWSMSQTDVDEIGYKTLNRILKLDTDEEVSSNKRLYIGKSEKDNKIQLYYYGRDCLMVDYWWEFVPKDNFKVVE